MHYHPQLRSEANRRRRPLQAAGSSPAFSSRCAPVASARNRHLPSPAMRMSENCCGGVASDGPSRAAAEQYETSEAAASQGGRRMGCSWHSSRSSRLRAAAGLGVAHPAAPCNGSSGGLPSALLAHAAVAQQHQPALTLPRPSVLRWSLLPMEQPRSCCAGRCGSQQVCPHAASSIPDLRRVKLGQQRSQLKSECPTID